MIKFHVAFKILDIKKNKKNPLHLRAFKMAGTSSSTFEVGISNVGSNCR